MKRFLVLGLLLISFSQFSFAQTPSWLRYPSISPDGKTIVFTYKGDLYKVATSGGTAIPLTMHEAHDFMPVWSNDGKTIAFASDRYGNFDVFSISVDSFCLVMLALIHVTYGLQACGTELTNILTIIPALYPLSNCTTR